MTLVFRKQRAQDRIKGRYSFDWGEDDYAIIDETQGVDEAQIGRIYKERAPAGSNGYGPYRLREHRPQTGVSPIRSMKRRRRSPSAMRSSSGGDDGARRP